MIKNEKLSIITDDKEEIATILFTFTENGKNYVVFEFDETHEVSAAVFVETKDGEGELHDIETDEEWALIDKVFDQYQEDLELEMEDGEFDA